jgi:hypothetical protein
MTKKKRTEDDDDFDEFEDDAFYDYEELEFKKTSPKHSLNARRRHEQLKEEKRLERLLNSDYDYFEDDDISYFDDLGNLNNYNDGDYDDMYK